MWIRDRLGRRIYNNDQVYSKCNKEYDVTVSMVEEHGRLFSLRGQTISWSEFQAWKDGKCCFMFQFQSCIVEDEQGLVTRIISIHLVLYF